ncbi:3-deoxy-7-phosphoheptulonate synthase [Thermoactinospora rubra]|uniref:3-deoxy-7-phosphoheptulonate synthase n=1 Tax=Thermoactinospora rubra TaxID=1088767 RepID=UPI000A0FDC43|nr:3-deoxy-7-phosphoheptulonate synthase [Thermoactinospora rubra]
MTTLIVLRDGTDEERLGEVVDRLRDAGVPCRSHSATVLSSPSPAARVGAVLAGLPQVAQVSALSGDYPLAARQSAAEGTRVRLGRTLIGGPDVVVIAGPCAVESRDQLLTTAAAVRDAGAQALRAGVFKPRTSPYSFQGLGADGLKLAAEARRETGLPVVSEVLDVRDVELMAGSVDMLQIGARNVQNYPLLREVGASGLPVLLKRGAGTTIDETLMAAEYLLDAGNHQVVLCERGIRSFETGYRFSLDLTAVTVFRERTHLPVIVDPSHAAGRRSRVIPLALAAAAAGADGVIVEVHCDPETARCDAEQALHVADLPALMAGLRPAAAAAGRQLAATPAGASG